MELDHLKESWEDSRDVYRLIKAVYPAFDLYADLDVPPEDWEALHQIESKTNARLRDELGEGALVEEQDRVKGPGASFIMAAFTHVNPMGSRFSDGTYGVYYSAPLEETCVREVAFHTTRFMADTQEPPQSMAFRFVKAELKGSNYNLYRQDWEWLRSENYARCQELGRQVRSVVDFIIYGSVRHPGNDAYAVFRPRALSAARHSRFIEMYWDGERITHSSGVEYQI